MRNERVTSGDIARLRVEAAQAGDERMVMLCDDALFGPGPIMNAVARSMCERVIRDARARAEESES